MLFTLSALSLFCSAALAVRIPESLEVRDSVSPPITNPNSSTVWVVGNQYDVVWDISTLPPLGQLSNPRAKIFLGQFEGDNQRTDFHPLAQDFLLTDGSVTLTCPDVPEGSAYYVNLFGSSSDVSASFKIVRQADSPGGGSSSAPPTSSSAAASSPMQATSAGTASATEISSTPASSAPSSPAPTSSSPPASASAVTPTSPVSAPASLSSAPTSLDNTQPTGGSNGASSWKGAHVVGLTAVSVLFAGIVVV